jgi:hypothetical protein
MVENTVDPELQAPLEMMLASWPGLMLPDSER